MSEYMKNQELSAELKTYAELDGTEVEEACLSLCHLVGYPDYVSDEFYEALMTEIMRQLVGFKECTKIVEYEETYTRKVRDLERL